MLIYGSVTDFSSLGLDNWGATNAYNLGNGKVAYFQGGLEVVVANAAVVPEPGTYVLLFVAGIALFLAARRSTTTQL